MRTNKQTDNQTDAAENIHLASLRYANQGNYLISDCRLLITMREVIGLPSAFKSGSQFNISESYSVLKTKVILSREVIV